MDMGMEFPLPTVSKTVPISVNIVSSLHFLESGMPMPVQWKDMDPSRFPTMRMIPCLEYPVDCGGRSIIVVPVALDMEN